MKTKAGYVTIIGKPNVGKSTLLNSLLGEKLSIITNKPQTTRKRVLGILSEEDYQIIFLDTPGLLEPKYLMQEKMMEHVEISVKDADVLVVIVDIAEETKKGSSLEDENVRKIVESFKLPKVLVINKIDLAKEDEVNNYATKIKNSGLFDEIIGISALNNFNTEELKKLLIEKLPYSPKFYPDDQLSDANERFFVSEIIREKIFETFSEEIPYSTEVLIEDFKERSKGKDYISASIVVEKESQKPIIIGKKGTAIKKIGELSRDAIKEFLERDVYLELRVKVRPKWRSDDKMMRNFGYDIKQ